MKLIVAAVGQRMPAGITGRNDKQFRQRIAARDINDLDIDSFEIFKSGDYQLLQLGERQNVRSVLLGQ